MKRLATLLIVAWTLACTGRYLPCAGSSACRAAMPAAEGDACCAPADRASDHEGRCQPDPGCTCCPQVRPAVTAVVAVASVPVQHVPVPAPRSDSVAVSPDPREILHVPRLPERSLAC